MPWSTEEMERRFCVQAVRFPQSRPRFRTCLLCREGSRSPSRCPGRDGRRPDEARVGYSFALAPRQLGAHRNPARRWAEGVPKNAAIKAAFVIRMFPTLAGKVYKTWS